MNKRTTFYKSFLGIFCIATATACAPKVSNEAQTLKGYFGDKYLIGAAINVDQASYKDSMAVEVLQKHFNSIVAENCMKSEEIHPTEDTFFWDDADQFVKFGEENDMAIIGHCLIWHSQCCKWFFVDEEGNQASPELLKERMKNHITAILTRYKGKIKGYDVVNEAILDNGDYRQSKFYEILGPEYIPWAFQCAQEADPDAELYYNDYSMALPGKRQAVVNIVKDLKARGIRIDAVGMQSHMGMEHPDFSEYEKTIEALIKAGVDVQFTELDMDAIPSVSFGAAIEDRAAYRAKMDPYPNGLPDSVSNIWNARMKQVFALYDKYSNHVKRVTAWGVSDGDSWKNDWPINGRTNYPLLFDRNYKMKPFLRDMLGIKEESK